MEYDSPDYRAAGAAYWREEAERDREEEAKRENAERLTVQLEKHLEQKEWDAQVHIRNAKASKSKSAHYLPNGVRMCWKTIAIAQALIEAGAGNTNAVTELLDGFTTWYIKELIA